MPGKLEKREQRILQAIVQHYVATAEPVGSRTLEKGYRLGISSATIRNVMADLEEMGLIEQPHTSAGRVPTDKGYRYYVDYLMMIQKLTMEEKEAIQKDHLAKVDQLDTVLMEASKILSLLSHRTGIVMAPSIQDSRCQYIELVRLNPSKILLVTVSCAGIVTNKIIHTRKDISQETLNGFSDKLFKKIKGHNFSEVKEIIIENLYKEKREYQELSGLAQKMVKEIFFSQEDNQLFLDGSLNFIEYPEFHDAAKIKNIFSALEEKKALIDIMKESLSNEGVKVVIGEENPSEAMKNCSLITATYKIDERPMGTVGILGPTRMPYDKMISIVDFTAKFISKLMKKNSSF